MDYRREIDGLRALAVVPVILFHAGFQTFSGGFVGVDVFFVISGYLITTIILAELEQGNFSIINFYERRARRILPALFLVMLVCLPFAWLWLLPSDMMDFSQSVAAVSVFASNILFWRESGYFDTAAELKPLLHTWSLAVEEQYYVLFPVFLMLTWRFGKRWVLVILAVVAVISLALAHRGATATPTATFFLLPTRGWELLVGAFVAFHFSNPNRWHPSKAVSEVGSALGLTLLTYAIFAYSKQTPFPSLYALVPTVGTALIILLATQKTFVGQLLASNVFVGIGLISYSAYLLHQPMFAFARHRSLEEPSQLVFGLLAICAVALACFSWRFIETPFRHKRWMARKQIFAYGFVFSVLFFGVGSVGYILDGNIGKVSADPKYLDLMHRMRGNYGLAEACEGSVSEAPDCRTNDEPEVLLWGDSYAMHLAQGFVASNPNIKMMQTTVSQCAPVLGIAPATAIFGARNCIDGNDYALHLLQTKPSIKYVILGSPSFLKTNSSLVDRTGALLDKNYDVEADFVRTIEAIKATGAKPIIFAPPPSTGIDIGQCLLKANIRNAPSALCDFEQASAEKTMVRVNDMLRRLSNRYAVMWLSDGICTNGICSASNGDVLIYRDGGHLSYEGSAFVGKKMNFYGLIASGTAAPRPNPGSKLRSLPGIR